VTALALSSNVKPQRTVSGEKLSSHYLGPERKPEQGRGACVQDGAAPSRGGVYRSRKPRVLLVTQLTVIGTSGN